jgi:hypothetical protein
MELLIPRGSSTTFTIQLKNDATGIPYSLTDITSMALRIYKKENQQLLGIQYGSVVDSDTGTISFTIPADFLDVAETGRLVDRAYLKSKYRAIFDVEFSDVSKNTVGIIEHVYSV